MQRGQWARPHGDSAVRPCVNLFPVLYTHGHSAVRAYMNLTCAAFRRAHRKPTAKWPRTAFYPLLPVPYFGSPLHSGHALLSTLFSLFSFFTKKAPLRNVVRNGAFGEKRFAPRCFHALLNALSSPRGALTAVFGMGTGVSPPPVARTKGIGSGRLVRGTALSAPCNIQQTQDGSLGGGFPPPSMLPARALPTGGGRGRAASRPHGLSEAVW